MFVCLSACPSLSNLRLLLYIADDRYRLRWFTPTSEVPLCGHATLSSAAVLFFCSGNQRIDSNFYMPDIIFTTSTPKTITVAITLNLNSITANFKKCRFGTTFTFDISLAFLKQMIESICKLWAWVKYHRK